MLGRIRNYLAFSLVIYYIDAHKKNIFSSCNILNFLFNNKKKTKHNKKPWPGLWVVFTSITMYFGSKFQQ